MDMPVNYKSLAVRLMSAVLRGKSGHRWDQASASSTRGIRWGARGISVQAWAGARGRHAQLWLWGPETQ